MKVEHIQPVILAAGKGTRLHPLTSVLPKPLLPVAGRPLLWYSLNSLEGQGLPRPLIVLDYLGSLIETYFARTSAAFRHMPGESMASAILILAEDFQSEALLGMSADTVLDGRAVESILSAYERHGRKDTVQFVTLDTPGHKKWLYDVSSNRLCDIRIAPTFTRHDRLLLVLRRESLLHVREALGTPRTSDEVPQRWRSYQTGWTLLLKVMCDLQLHVAAEHSTLPVLNVNVASDLDRADAFVQTRMTPQ